MATASIRDWLARLPGGFKGKPRTWSQVSDHLWNNYLASDAEKYRVKKFEERQRLFLGCGETDLEDMIDRVFKDPEVKAKRKEWVSFAKYNNVLRRVILEQATVYSLPAERTVGIAPSRGVNPTPEDEAKFLVDLAAFDEQNRRYNEVLRLCRFHEVMQRLNALLLLNRAVVIVPRMREQPDGSWVPTIDLVTPSRFHAVRDTIDPTLCIALIFQTDFQLADPMAQGPKWMLLSWHERAWINSAGRIMPDDGGSPAKSMIEEHGLGRIPAILATIDPPDGKLLDESTGEDLVAAQKLVTFFSVLMAKEAKSATLSTVVQGDVSAAVRKQADDSEVPLMLPEGVSVSTLDRAMDFLKFDDAGKRVSASAAANHGVAEEVMSGGVPTSADARDLVRVPLRERRLAQHVPLRQIEHDIVQLLSQVVAQYRADLAFTTEGWNIDFADPQTPLGTREALDVLEKELSLGLKSELRAIMDRNPDLSYEQAKQILLQLIEDRTFRIEAMRDFMAASGGMPAAAQRAGAQNQNESDDVGDEAPDESRPQLGVVA